MALSQCTGLVRAGRPGANMADGRSEAAIEKRGERLDMGRLAGSRIGLLCGAARRAAASKSSALVINSPRHNSLSERPLTPWAMAKCRAQSSIAAKLAGGAAA